MSTNKAIYLILRWASLRVLLTGLGVGDPKAHGSARDRNFSVVRFY